MPGGSLFLHGNQIRFQPIGHAQVNVGAAAVGLPNLPANWQDRVSRVVIRNLAAPINWRDDGADPDASHGFPSLADEIFVYDGSDLDKFKMIRASGTDVDVRVIYMGT